MDLDRRLDAGLGVEVHVAGGLGEDAVDGGEAQAGALAARFGAEARLGDAF
jgi:hypothetical protein